MKTRRDFVSNSSSCSFVIERDAAAAVAALLEAVKGSIINYGDLEGINVVMYVAKDRLVDFQASLSAEGFDVNYMEFYPDYYGEGLMETSICAESLFNSEADPATFGAVEKVMFSSENGSCNFILYLMYLFFERAGFSPDKSNSEQDISIKNSVIAALTTPAEPAKLRKKGKSKNDVQDKNGE